MKNPNRVAELLAELRELADNDFERHRIDVLERDLTEPPKVEQVDDFHQKFLGKTYRKDKTNHYVATSILHRDVWQYYRGEIPQEFEIHHINGDPENNVVENFQCLPRQEHRRLHNPKQNTSKVETRICVICGTTFTCRKGLQQLTCSATCAFKNRKPPKGIVAVCEVCGKEFTTIRRGVKYCSQKCRVHANYERTKIKQICPVCGKEFMSPKNPPSTCCSLKCAWEQRRHSKSVER